MIFIYYICLDRQSENLLFFSIFIQKIKTVQLFLKISCVHLTTKYKVQY